MLRIACWLITLVLVVTAAELVAQTPAAAPTTQAVEKAAPPRLGTSFVDLIIASGAEGFTIIALSIVALALVVDYLRLLRGPNLHPPGLADRVRDALQSGQVTQAASACQAQPSVLAHVIQAGLAEIDGGWTLVEKTMEDALADQAARLTRRIDYLSVIANIAPMLGLLGTVRGMVLAFQQVAETQGVARAADLAGGIYLALVTTVEGLVVAIPALAVYALFRSRLDQLISETAAAAHHSFGPLRRVRTPTVARMVAKPPPLEGRGPS